MYCFYLQISMNAAMATWFVTGMQIAPTLRGPTPASVKKDTLVRDNCAKVHSTRISIKQTDFGHI